jgi:hypothetical protein
MLHPITKLRDELQPLTTSSHGLSPLLGQPLVLAYFEAANP